MKKVQVKVKLFLMLFSAAFTVMSCQDDDSDDILRMTETEFMVQAANSDLFEIQTGKMAAGKSTVTEVRNFGQQMVTEHTATSTELKTLASQKKITLPDSLSDDKRVIRARLADQTGSAFDKNFVNAQVVSHDEAISLYEKASRELQDPDVKAFAAKTLPNLVKHREHAVMVKTKTDAL